MEAEACVCLEWRGEVGQETERDDGLTLKRPFDDGDDDGRRRKIPPVFLASWFIRQTP